MKRKEFIRNVGFLGVGVSLAPWKLVTAKSSIQRFRLPPASVHIPHGNFAATNLKSLYIPEMELEITVQMFMRNGIEFSPQDLTVYNIARGSESINVGLSNGSTVIVGRIKDIQTQSDNKKVHFESNDFTLILSDDEDVILIKH